MKTRNKIFIVIIIGLIGFFSWPPVLSFTCDVREIYDGSCPRISGIAGFNIWPTSFAPWPHTSQDCDEICKENTKWPAVYQQRYWQCADMFNQIYAEYLLQSSICESCEPVLFRDFIKEYDDFINLCGNDLEDWDYLSDYNNEAWKALESEP